MTEAEWNACTDPEKMLQFLIPEASDRKLQLFACACCRRVWQALPPYHRRTVEVAEAFADGLATDGQLIDSYQVGKSRPGSLDEGEFNPAGEGADYDPYCVPWPSSAASACALGGMDAAEDASYWSARLTGWTRPDEVYREERKVQSQLLRDVVGNPFRPVTQNPSWLSPTLTGLAETIYQERAFDRLPILADALEDAGCTNVDILHHCRQPGEHVRGCWVIDLLTGRK